MAANEAGKLYYGLGLDNSQLRADATQASDILKGIGSSAEAEGGRIDSAYRKAAGVIGGYFTLAAAKSFVTDLVRVRAEVESLSISFETLLGSKQRADAMLGQIKSYAASTPMQLSDLAKGAQMLLSFNVEAERVMPTLKQLGDISMGDAQKFNSLTLAFSQMSSAGRLMGQDLLQMINAGFNPLAELSAKTGRSIGQLRKDMESGAITSQMVADAFASAAAEGGKFHGMLEQQSRGINGRLSALRGAVADMFNSIGEENQQFIASTIQGLTNAVKHYREVGEAIAAVIAIYGTYKAAVMATEAVSRAAATVKHTEEAASLYQLLSAEQKARISKLELSKTSKEYAAAVKGEVAANVKATQQALAKARAEVSAAKQAVVARREEYLAAKQLESQRALELRQVAATGTAKQVEAARRKLSAAEARRESAALAFQSASRDFHSRKLAVETAARTANTTATAANTAAQTANSRAVGVLSVAKTRLASITARVNALVMANPYAVAAAAVAALAYGIYRLATYQTEGEKAQRKLNDAIKEASVSSGAELRQLDFMFARLKNATEGTDEYRAAKEAIMGRYGEYLKTLGDERTALDNVAKAYGHIADAIGKAERARSMEKVTAEAAKTLGEKEEAVKSSILKQLEKKYGSRKGTDGVSLSAEYYLKIKPIIEGKEDITPEVEKILKDFDRVQSRMVGMSGEKPVYESYVSNSIRDELNSLREATAVYSKVMREAQAEFGESRAEKATQFDATTASLQALMEQLPRARAELDALKKSEQPDRTAIAAKGDEVKRIEAQILARERELRVIRDVEERLEVLKAEQKSYGKDDAEYAALGVRIARLQEKLPQPENRAAQVQKEIAERNRLIAEYGDAVKRQVEQTELDIRQARIDAMEEGYDKELEQVELAYRRMVFANQQREEEMVRALQELRKLEWDNEEVQGKKPDRVTVTAADLSPEQQAQLREYYAVAEEIRVKASRDALDRMLSDYLTYEEQRSRVTADYEKKRRAMQNADGSIRAGFSQGNVDELNRNEEEALAAVDEKFAAREDTFQAWMNAVSNMTLEQLEQVLDRAKKELEELEGTGTAGGEQLAVARAKVSTARDRVSRARAENGVGPGKRSMKEWEDLYKVLREVEREFGSIGDAVGGTAKVAIDTAGAVLSSTVSMISSIVQLTTASSAGMQAAGLAASNAVKMVERASVILTIISAAMQIATTIANAFNNDGAHQREVERLQGRIEQLQWELDNADVVRVQQNSVDFLRNIRDTYAEVTKEVVTLHNEAGWRFSALKHKAEIVQKSVEKLSAVYGNISYTADKALGEKKFSKTKEQLKNIAEQQLLIQQQIDAEGSKKKSDGGKIADLERRIQELGQEANKLINELLEGIMGGSAEQIASELGDAFIEAFRSGEDAAEAWGSKVNDIVGGIVKRMLISQLIEEPIGEIFDKYKAKWFPDGEFIGIDPMRGTMGELENDLNSVGATFESIFSSLPDNIKKYFSPVEVGREASKKGFASASQDSVDELNGRATAIQTHTYSLAENSRILVENSHRTLTLLTGIDTNTRSLSRLVKIENDIESMKRSMDDIAVRGIKLRA